MGRHPDSASVRETPISFRPTPQERVAVDRQRAKRGGMSTSAYIRWLIAQDGKRIAREESS